MKDHLKKVMRGGHLDATEAEAAMDHMMSGKAQSEEIAAYLGALAARGETVAEILGSIRSLRRHARSLPVTRRDLIDVCGTGGDGAHTFNISTANALLLAAAGLGVVKHGNRAVSSVSGSADVLEAMGISIHLSPDQAALAVETLGFAFLFAPDFHPAMAHVGPTRRALGVRTLFNLLGPLANPAPVRRQVVGVFDPKWLEPMAQTLATLGADDALIVWGEDGLDEVSLSAPTRAVRWHQGQMSHLTLTPEDFGLIRVPKDALKGGDARVNAAIIEDILTGRDQGPRRDVVLANAAAALVVAGLASTWSQGAQLARSVLESGKGAHLLASLRRVRDSMVPQSDNQGTRDTRPTNERPSAQPPSALLKIRDAVAARLALRQEALPLPQIQARLAQERRRPHDFSACLRGPSFNVIAEVKRASPSQGKIAPGVDPVQVAGAYLHNGARALSVLTEEDFFRGHLDDLRHVRKAYPEALILQKDFVIDPYQIYEAALAGADAVLIIIALVGEEIGRQFLETAQSLGLTALVEVHTEAELAIARRLNAKVIGINNRSLETLQVSLDVTRRLRPLCPPNAWVVCESGLSSHGELRAMAELGCHGFLVGTSLMRTGDPGQALAKLLGGDAA